jgi:hypothetical protein
VILREIPRIQNAKDDAAPLANGDLTVNQQATVRHQTAFREK